MERRILKDFHIGSVDSALDNFRLIKEPVDIFTHLAKAIGKKTSVKRKSKHWNSLVKQRSLDGDPIGTSVELEKLAMKRRSLRKTYSVSKSQSDDTLSGENSRKLQFCSYLDGFLTGIAVKTNNGSCIQFKTILVN